MSGWTFDDIPDQSGRTAVVTGANSGLGFVCARELALRGAHVVLACRSAVRGAAALEAISRAAPGARVELEALDLSELASVEAFAGRFLSAHPSLDLLINNAGVMAPPRSLTADGFELQIGTNHLGHFALTGRLLGALAAGAGARVVTLSSNGHKLGRIDFDDLHYARRYSRWLAYCRSKLANLLFALELDRRLRASSSAVRSLAAHPGYAATNLQHSTSAFVRLAMVAGDALLAQSADRGALPALYAACEPSAEGGAYIGPSGPGEFRGAPRPVSPSRAARDEAVAARLWEVSEELTGVRFAFASSAPSAA
jgi:NAD(P)-dependent dehydrogenase (short-subunit alcohol dehydrogenase family)